ncbi:HET-domain-containing protein [Lophium mytilinum]|uniref:HET-domain-containing protein n=1 Tax=Lophium mytilinum TaxID=390894 RepID=A0A6A6QDU1_9PEZI|nr:HET-domain-containing protein [Lophium mytilinum]
MTEVFWKRKVKAHFGSKSSTASGKEPYRYVRLDPETEEIRLIRLLPGKGKEPIRFELFHVPLRIPEERPTDRMSLKELRNTLPPGYKAFETVDNEYIFWSADTDSSSWVHPDSDLHPSRYAQLPEVPGLDFRPRYEALSYAWGSADDPKDAYVHYSSTYLSSGSECTFSARLQIRRDLASAMRHLRYPRKTRALWIDAVCINQEDEDERNEQVKSMASIYRLAERVVVWLGPQADRSRLAMKTLDYIGAQLEYTKDNILVPSPTAMELDWFDDDALPYGSNLWRDVEKLMKRQWFKRLWVWQEVHLANSHAVMQCGRDSIPWYRFRRAVNCIAAKADQPSAQLRSELRHLRHLTGFLPDLPLRLILSNMRGQMCSDPRDKVYGLLGLLGSDLAKIEPRYSDPVGVVYRDAFLAHCNHVQRLELLPYCDLKTALPDTPSWVPNWSADSWTSVNWGSLCSGVSRAHFTYTHPGVLELVGVHCATVEAVRGPLADEREEALEEIRNWAADIIKPGSSYVTGESLEDTFALTIRQNEMYERWPEYDDWPTAQEWKSLCKRRFVSPEKSAKGHDLASGERTKFDEKDESHMTEAVDSVGGHTFVTAERGYMGLGPRLAKSGDVICVLLGCDNPIFLRPSSHGQFLVVGTGYVHGLSDASVLLGPLPKHWRVQVTDAEFGENNYSLYNSSTNKHVTMSEDPRLGPLENGWEAIERDRVRGDPGVFEMYRNKITGEEMDSDPRMLPEALKARGVPLQTFQLI